MSRYHYLCLATSIYVSLPLSMLLAGTASVAGWLHLSVTVFLSAQLHLTMAVCVECLCLSFLSMPLAGSICAAGSHREVSEEYLSSIA